IPTRRSSDLRRLSCRQQPGRKRLNLFRERGWHNVCSTGQNPSPRKRKTMNKALSLLAPLGLALGAAPQLAQAGTVEVSMTVKEVDIAIDNAGNKRRMWTYEGTIPGPLVRVKQGDLVKFTLKNDAGNANSHSMDFHAAQVDVLDEFAEVKPGDTKKF